MRNNSFTPKQIEPVTGREGKTSPFHLSIIHYQQGRDKKSTHRRQSCTRRNRSALPTMEMELKLMAALAQIGPFNSPRKG
jgi:hypothetical protein